MRKATVAMLALSLLPTVASASVASPSDPSAIVGGENVGPCGYPSVVAMMVDDAQVCTGSLVAPDLVVTAAHCLPDALNRVVFGEDVTAPARSIEIVTCAVNPLFDGTGPADTALCTLAEEVTDVQPIPLASECEAELLVQVGNPVTLVGFGVNMAEFDPSGNPDFPFMTSGNGIKRTTAQTLEQPKNQTTREPWAAESVLPLVGDGTNTACFGDSGGPAFGRLPNGELRQVGIGHGTHQGDPDPTSPCDHGIWYTATVTHLEWFEYTAQGDLTPCHDGLAWARGEGCQGFVVDPEEPAGGDWSTGCQGTLNDEVEDACFVDGGTGSTGGGGETAGDESTGSGDPGGSDDSTSGDPSPAGTTSGGDDSTGPGSSGGESSGSSGAADSSGGGCRVGGRGRGPFWALGLLMLAVRRRDT